MSVLMHVTADAEKETKQKRRLKRKKPIELEFRLLEYLDLVY